MKFLPFVMIFGFQIMFSNACCSEASTIIQIKNYEGPIYLNAPQTPCDDRLLHTSINCDFDCSCLSKPTSTCFPINTASAGTLYQYPTLYQDTQCTPGRYNVPSYQDCPIISITPQNTLCSVPKDDCSFVCGKCGKRF